MVLGRTYEPDGYTIKVPHLPRPRRFGVRTLLGATEAVRQLQHVKGLGVSEVNTGFRRSVALELTCQPLLHPKQLDHLRSQLHLREGPGRAKILRWCLCAQSTKAISIIRCYTRLTTYAPPHSSPTNIPLTQRYNTSSHMSPDHSVVPRRALHRRTLHLDKKVFILPFSNMLATQPSGSLQQHGDVRTTASHHVVCFTARHHGSKGTERTANCCGIFTTS
jgi:hypothetical protein